MPFYDYHLKGKQNGWNKRPKVRLHVGGHDEWRTDSVWPPREAKYKPFYLSGKKSGSVTSLNDGTLSTTKPAANGGSTDWDYPHPGWKLGTVGFGPQGPDPVRGVVTFTTEPLEKDVEIAGPIVLELRASSTNTDTDFVIKLSDQQPQSRADRANGLQPASQVVSKGWMRASHREKDKKNSTKMRPFYTHRNPQPINPGEIYTYEIEVMACAHRFKKGHRIRLEIVNGDSPLTDSLFTHQYLYYKVGKDTFWHNAKNASCLKLPIVPTK